MTNEPWSAETYKFKTVQAKVYQALSMLSKIEPKGDGVCYKIALRQLAETLEPHFQAKAKEWLK